MVAINEAGFDWSYMADDEVPTNMALMTFSDTKEVITNNSKTWLVFTSYNAIAPPPTGLFAPQTIDFDATVYAFLANQPNGSQLVHKDLERIHEDDLKEIDLKSQLALLSMRARRYFQRTGKKITINWSDIAGSRKTVIMEDTSSKAMMAIDGVGFYWSYMADDEVLTNMALMDFSDSESLDKLIGSQIIDNSKTGLGFTSYNAIAPPPTGLFAHPSIDLFNSGLKEFKQPEFKGYGPKDSKSVSVDTSNEIKKAHDALIIED
nr:hypothetical protein [Tanacetum cinerariifolium]